MNGLNPTLVALDEYFRQDTFIHSGEGRDAFVSVVRQLLNERCAYGLLRQKAICHARRGDVYFTKKILARLGIDTTRIDAILPLIRD
jgi:hypothetical protein